MKAATNALSRLVKLRGKTGEYNWTALRGLHAVRGDWLLDGSKLRAGDNPHMKYVPSTIMWAVYRDGVIYRVYDKPKIARDEARHYRLGGNSKHKWTTKPVLVAE